MRPMLPVALAALLVLAGCGAGGPSPTATPTAMPTATPTASPTASPTATPTATATATPTATATATPTATPTPTPTATPTPEPTAAPRPEEVTVGLAQWAEYDTQGTTLGYQIESWRDADYVEGVGNAPEGQTWMIANVWIRNRGGEAARIGWTQYQMEDFNGVTRSPDREAMANASETLDESRLITPGDGVRARVIFLTNAPDQPTFYIEPHGNSEGPTVIVET